MHLLQERVHASLARRIQCEQRLQGVGICVQNSLGEGGRAIDHEWSLGRREDVEQVDADVDVDVDVDIDVDVDVPVDVDVNDSYCSGRPPPQGSELLRHAAVAVPLLT